MTVEHIAMVYAAGGMSASEKHLLGAYCNHTDAHGYCWPGVDRLADETGMSRATVKRVNAQLRSRNLIKSVHRTNPKTGLQITNLTRLNVPLLASMRRPDQDYGDNLVEAITFDGEATSPQVSPGAQNEPPRGLKMSPRGAQDEPRGGLKMSPETSIETSIEPPPPTAPESQPPQLPVAVVREEEDRSAGKSTTTAEDEALALVDAAVALWEAEHRPPTKAERLRLTQRAAQALSVGARPWNVSEALTRDLSPSQVRTTAVQVVMARTARPGWADAPASAPRPSKPSRPEWCGRCNEQTRMIQYDDGATGRCFGCHPHYAEQDAGAA